MAQACQNLLAQDDRTNDKAFIRAAEAQVASL
jgi:hypothetical protein